MELFDIIPDQDRRDTVPKNPSSEINSIIDFLKKIPPDWDAAYKHRKANITNRSTRIKHSSDGEFCPCCHLPIPNPDEKFTLWSDVAEFDILGPGIPLFFYFMQYMMWYLLMIFFVIYIQFKVNLDKIESSPQPSFGAFLVERDEKYINTMSFFFMFSILTSTIFFQVMISLLKKNCLDLDNGVVTPSDFCLKIRVDKNFRNYSSQNIQEEVKLMISKQYNIGQIEYVNPVYNMRELLQKLKKLKVAKENKIKIDAYIKRMGIDQRTYTLRYRSKMVYENIPTEKKFGIIERKLDLNVTEDQVKVLQSQIREMKNNIETMENFTGIVFVVFKNTECLAQVINSNSFDECDRAPEPSDVIWENLSFHKHQRVQRTIGFFTITVLMMSIAFTLSWLADRGEAKGPLKQLFTILFIFAIDQVLDFSLKKFSEFEGHHSLTQLYVSKAAKTSMVKLVSITVVQYLNYSDPLEWFEKGNLADLTWNFILISAILQPIFYRAGGFESIVRQYKKWKQMNKKNCRIPQLEANKLCEGGEFHVNENMQEFFVFIGTSIIYSFIYPQLIIIAIIGLFFKYITYKYMLINKMRRPVMLSEDLIISFASRLPFFLIIWSIIYIIFIFEIQRAYSLTLRTGFAFASLAISIIQFILRKFLQNLQSPLILKFQNVQHGIYENHFMTFPTDYDRQNPLSQKQGELRLLSHQIQMARERQEREGLQMQINLVQRQQQIYLKYNKVYQFGYLDEISQRQAVMDYQQEQMQRNFINQNYQQQIENRPPTSKKQRKNLAQVNAKAQESNQNKVAPEKFGHHALRQNSMSLRSIRYDCLENV